MRGKSAMPNQPPLPVGPTTNGWQQDCEGPFRILLGQKHTITDSEAFVQARAWQDGQGALECLFAHVEPADNELNSDQARELASALLQAAAELDGWSI